MSLRWDPDLLNDLGCHCPSLSEPQFPHVHTEGTDDYCGLGPWAPRKFESHVIGKNTHLPCRVTLCVCSFLLPVA